MSKEGYGSMVRVVPIQVEDIPANEHRLIELFEQSFRVSFAEEELGKTYGMERVETLRSYLGKAKLYYTLQSITMILWASYGSLSRKIGSDVSFISIILSLQKSIAARVLAERFSTK